MPSSTEQYLLAIDPGLDKLGMAILDAEGEIEEKSVIARDRFSDSISGLINRYSPSLVVVGDSTGSDWVNDVLSALGKLKISRVSEKGSTLEARELAWKHNPPGGLWKITPRIFWPTPSEIDAWAAVVIGRRALAEFREMIKPA